MIYFTPGPSQLYPTVKKHILNALKHDIASISHRSEAFHEIIRDINTSLKLLLSIPDEYQIFFLSSATECMERIIENCVHKKSFHFVNGAFSKRFYSVAADLKKSPLSHDANSGEGFEFKNIKIPKNSELIAITQNETSTGVAIPVEFINKLSNYNPESLIAVDITSSVPYVNLDYSKLDCVFFSVQKGFGLPSGLGVLIVSPRALKKSGMLQGKGVNIGSYHKFSSMLAQSQKLQTVETPNILGLYLFEKVLKDMLDMDIENIRLETDKKADMLYEYFKKHQKLKLFVVDKRYRSKTAIVVMTQSPSAQIIDKIKKGGYLVGSGYGSLRQNQIRIANFPSHTLKNVDNLLLSFNDL